MSIQAVAWALEQDFTGRTPKGRSISAHVAKLVLISLANHADHVSGHCWPSGETIAREASCSVRSAYRMINALARNGFVDVRKVRGDDGKQRSNNYWIRFDRKPAPWQFFADDEPEDDEGGNDGGPQDDGGPHDNLSSGDGLAQVAENDEESSKLAYGPQDSGVPRHVMPEPSYLEPSPTGLVAGAEPFEDSPKVSNPPALAQGARPKAATDGSKTVPASFDPNERKRQQQASDAREKAKRAGRQFVIEGSRGWEAWLDLKFNLTGIRQLFAYWSEHHKRSGALFPSLFPPPAEIIAGLTWDQIYRGTGSLPSDDRRGKPSRPSPS